MDDEDFSGLLDPANMGRFGSIVAMVMGAGLIGTAAFMWDAGVLWLGAPLGFIMLLVGFVGYRRAAAQADEEAPRMDAPAFKELVKHHDLGFYVCTKCRSLNESDWGNGCANCGSVAEFLEVQDEDDRRIALASIT